MEIALVTPNEIEYRSERTASTTMKLLIPMEIIQLFSNIRNGFNLAFFRPVRTDQFHFSLDQVFLLTGISLALNLGHAYIVTEPERYFNIYGLTTYGTLYALFFFSALIIARLHADITSALRLVVVLLSMIPGLWLGSLTLGHIAGLPAGSGGMVMPWTPDTLYFLWFVAITYRAIQLVYSVSVLRTVMVVGLYSLINVTPQLVIPDTRAWYSYTPEADWDSQINVEDTFYSQRRLLDQKTGDLLPQRPGITDLYFLGFGSYADQDVFLHEVRFVKNLFDTRFDTEGRSVALINNRGTVDKFPLANQHNLAISLEHMANLMDVEEDVLFLFLTSHGSRDHKLSVNFWPLELNDLSADTLKKTLQRSGIKWRVIVVSACYSGGFIDALKDDYTLVMTAARKDRTSFGCSNDRKFTYFGEAYFRDQLQNELSFIKAFHKTRDAIKSREAKENIKASFPQIYIGQSISPKLAEIKNRLRGD